MDSAAANLTDQLTREDNIGKCEYIGLRAQYPLVGLPYRNIHINVHLSKQTCRIKVSVTLL